MVTGGVCVLNVIWLDMRPVKQSDVLLSFFHFFLGGFLVLTKLFNRQKASLWPHMMTISHLTKLNDAWRKLETHASQIKVDVFLVSPELLVCVKNNTQ